MSASQGSGRRVVITGMGVICPLGLTQESLWEALTTGRSGVHAVASLTGENLPVSFGGECRDFKGTVEGFGPLDAEQKKALRRALRMMSRECQMGVAAAQRALTDAHMVQGQISPERIGIVFGSDYQLSVPEDLSASFAECQKGGGFEFSRWAGEGLPKIEPLWLLKYLPNMPAGHIAINNDLRGHSNSLTQREATSNLAVGEALRVIQRGHAEMMVTGATGSRIHPMKALQAALQEELANPDQAPETASRPFDLNRTGMVLGEGAGAVVLEELESAQKRGATIYAEVLGAASSAVADRNFVAHRDRALQNVVRACLADAGLNAESLGHIHAHGLSTRSCDAEEARAIRAALGKQAGHVPVTAAKSYFGNLGAGSGVVELVASVLSLRQGKLFPVLNYGTPDPECPISVCQSADVHSGSNFINLNVTPQGQASGVLVGRFT